MHNLKAEHPKVQKRFEVGFPVIQRIDRLWLGLSPDLIIEQVLLRSLKTSGGLTGGGDFQCMPVLKITRQCRDSRGLTTTLGNKTKT